MPKIDVHLETPVPPDRVRAALLDFTDNRPAVWPGIDPSLYEVYEIHETWADIQEGSKMPGTKFWAREHYDWLSPDVVTWTVTESNFCVRRHHSQGRRRQPRTPHLGQDADIAPRPRRRSYDDGYTGKADLRLLPSRPDNSRKASQLSNGAPEADQQQTDWPISASRKRLRIQQQPGLDPVE